VLGRGLLRKTRNDLWMAKAAILLHKATQRFELGWGLIQIH